jgi:hypothetical protein
MIPEENYEEPASVIEKPVYLFLKADIFDPLQEEPSISSNLKVGTSQDYYIVHFDGLIQGEWKKNLEDLKVIIIGYIPDNAYLVKMNGEVRKKIEHLPFVRWIGPYQPGYKLESGLLENSGEIELNVKVFRDSKENILEVRNNLKALGGVITYDGNDNYVIRVKIDATRIKDIAFIPEVEWIGEYRPPIPMMDYVRDFTGADLVHLNGFNGSGIVGEVNDNGFDVNHPDFAGQIIGTDGTVSDGAHGTCTFGIIFSTGANNGAAKGMLPGGKGVMASYWDVTRTSSISNLVNNWGGVFQSNSWGLWADSTYTSESQESDQAVFDYDVVMLWAAGNEGTSPETVCPDAVAKNVIGVGALRHWDNNDRTDDLWVDTGWGSTPAQGPAADGRIKPDLSGPFDWIYTTDSVDGDGEDGYSPGNYLDDMGGTSASTPICAGAAGLVYQMYRDNHFGNNLAGNMPHAATVKAILIADAYQYEFSQATRYQQGWGLVDVGNVYNIGQDHFIIDESTPLQLGQQATYNIQSTGTGPLKISLVWTDVPGTSSSSKHLINDLNLKVTDPDGIVYWGNNGLVTSHWSSSGGSADSKNNVENVFIEIPKPGAWTLEVIGQNIPSDGVPSTPETDQAFALVASNAVETFRVDITNPSNGDSVKDITPITGTSFGNIVQVEVNIDNLLWEPATGTASWSYSWDTTAYSDGPHTIYARAYNGSAYSTIRSIEVTVDNTPPSTQLIIGDPRYFNGTLWTVGTSTEFTLASDDGNGSGVSDTWHYISHEGAMVQNWIDDTVFTLSWGEGNYTIQYYAEDNLTNMETINTTTVYLDSTPPETNMEISPPKYRINASDSWNVTPDSIFTLTPSEHYSGIQTTWYTVDGEYFEDVTFDISAFNDGPHTITWGSIDYLGNNESGNMETVILDSEPPQIGLNITGQKYRANNNNSWNVTKSTLFTINPLDFYSGINFTWYTIDGLYYEEGNFTLNKSFDGHHVIHYGACDFLGNNLTGNYLTVYLDSRHPTTNAEPDEQKYRSSTKHNWNVTESTVFNLISEDEYSGVHKTWYILNGTYFENDMFTLEGLPNGTYTIEIGSIDNLGQNETQNSITVNLDMRPPTTKLIINQPKYSENSDDPVNVTTETLFMLSGEDDFSGIEFAWFYINGEYFEGTTFDLLDYDEDYHTIMWGSTDNLGNNEIAQSQVVYLCKSTPKTTRTIHGEKYRASEEEDWMVTNKTQFKLHPSELHQGLDVTWYKINGDYYEDISFSLSEYKDGSHTISWGSRDNFGKNETGNFMSVILDTTPPMTTIKIGDPKYQADEGDVWTVNKSTL